MTYVISVANEKGGVAKTTTTISLGSSLADMGYKVLLVDLDSQANLSLAMGIEPAKVSRTIVSVLLEKAPLSSIMLPTNLPNLSIIAANGELGLVERMLPSHQNYETTLSNAIASSGIDFDYIVIDCPPFLGAITLNALTASNLLLVPTQAEYFSIIALRNMMSLIRRIRGSSNPKLTYRLLLTLFDRRNRIHRSLSEQLRTTFGTGVLDTVIEVDTKLRECTVVGVPIIHHAPKSRASLQYRALAQEIVQYGQESA
jgi:chromosome partitioning protein